MSVACAEYDKFSLLTQAWAAGILDIPNSEMKVVLVRKLAERMDGIDVRAHRVGDVLNLSGAEAQLLVAEHWAIPDRRVEHDLPPDVERRRTTDDPALPRSY